MRRLLAEGLALFTASLLILGAAPCGAQGRSFPDVSEDSWYYGAVMEMVDDGIFTGYPDGRFGPEDPISIGQFVTVAGRCAMLLPLPAERCSSDHWAAGICEAAMESGWFLEGQLPAAEDPYDQPIARALAVQILMNGVVPEFWCWPESGGRSVQLPEGETVDLVERTYLSRGVAAGIILGDENGVFDPHGSLTRAEACTMLTRSLAKYGYPRAVVIDGDQVRCSTGDSWLSMTGFCGAAGVAAETKRLPPGSAATAQTYPVRWDQVTAYTDYLCAEAGFRPYESTEGVGIAVTRYVDLCCIDVVFLQEEDGSYTGTVYFYGDVPLCYLSHVEAYVPNLSSVVGPVQVDYVTLTEPGYDRGETHQYLLSEESAYDLLEEYLTALEQEWGFDVERWAALDTGEDGLAPYATAVKRTEEGRVGIDVLLFPPDGSGQLLCVVMSWGNASD